MFRYLALVWNDSDGDQARAADIVNLRLNAAGGHWTRAFDRDGLRVFVAEADEQGLGCIPLANQGGVVMGALFERNRDPENDAASPKAQLDEPRSARLIRNGGRPLVEDYWGNYVAFISDREARKTYIVKDPTGDLPCFETTFRDVRLFFTCLSDCLDLRLMPFTVNWEYVRSRAAYGSFDLEQSSFREIAQVYRGECVELTRAAGPLSISRKFYWEPMAFTEPSQAMDDPIRAARALRATIRSCIHTLAAPHANVIAQISGGLDSSIVLGCLATAPSRPRIACYTHFIPGAPSDERRWARIAAGRVDCIHSEVAFDPRHISLESIPALAPSVEPTEILVHFQRGPVERRLASEYDATALFTGEGGDSALCCDSYSLAIDDYIRRRGLNVGALRIAARVARRRDRTVWTVLGRALRRRVAGSRMKDHVSNITRICELVNGDLRLSLTQKQHYPHPWFSSLEGVPWGTIWRLGTVKFAPQFYDLSASPRTRAPVPISPFSVQPAVEMCLRIPSDVHFEDGRDRGLARRAFAPELPEPIRRREWKDTAPQLFSEIIHRNLKYIRAELLDSALTRDGILDRRAVEQALSAAPAKTAAVGSEILGHLNLAIWLRQSLQYSQHAVAS